MTIFMLIRDRIRRFAVRHERILRWIGHALAALVSLYTVRSVFPVEGVLQSMGLLLVLTALSAFIPMSGITLVVSFYLLLHLALISPSAALMTGLLLVISYLITGYYQTEAKYQLFLIPVGHELGVPYLFPMGGALTGSVQDVSAVIFGSILSYYLSLVKKSLALLQDTSSGVTAWSLLLNKMFQEADFYLYLVAMIALFLVTYLVRTRKIRFSWIFAVIFGLLTEFAISFGGKVFSGDQEGLPALVLSNLIAFLVGIIMSYLLVNLNYNRVENVQYEDDEYYYYVTAIPKIQLTEESKTVKKFTRTQRRRK